MVPTIKKISKYSNKLVQVTCVLKQFKDVQQIKQIINNHFTATLAYTRTTILVQTLEKAVVSVEMSISHQ